MKFKFILLCFILGVIFVGIAGFNSVFALGGIFFFIFGVILVFIKADEVLNK